MHPLFVLASGLSRDVIGAAVDVHKNKGPLAAGIDLRMVIDDLLRLLCSLMFKNIPQPLF
jgi:hypothetical protein